jgi:hypothetical protein
MCGCFEGPRCDDFLVAGTARYEVSEMVGIASGINGRTADTTQMGNFLPTAHATSIPM